MRLTEFLSYPCFIEIPVSNANSVDSDQTPRSAASDVGLYCLQISLLRDARHTWVNGKSTGPKHAERSLLSHVLFQSEACPFNLKPHL